MSFAWGDHPALSPVCGSSWAARVRLQEDAGAAPCNLLQLLSGHTEPPGHAADLILNIEETVAFLKLYPHCWTQQEGTQGMERCSHLATGEGHCHVIGIHRAELVFHGDQFESIFICCNEPTLLTF